MIQMVRVLDALPEGFGRLEKMAIAEGVRNMSLLAEQWATGEQRFTEPGALFAAFIDGELAGVGGVAVQTGQKEPAMRMRRLYVAPPFRRAGVGQVLAGSMIQQGLQTARLLTANARASAAAAPFWEAMGFEPVAADGFTHQLLG
ncbi:MAG: GNAT family N-acetyltransferase [Caulobacter sp.]|nr:GNAT family N-acetyltransferase [Caulobacter sp.]